jgi:CRISPR-associated endonuclease/helicase Cas3
LAGRKLAIASATIPPPVARHLFAAYQQGCAEHAMLFGKPFPVYAGWFAEDCGDNKTLRCDSAAAFNEAHAAFVQARLERLNGLKPRRAVRRFAFPSVQTKEAMFDAVFEACLELHQAHHCVDPETGQRVSIGAVQWGRVSTCMDFSLHAARLPVGEVAHFLVCHHARFPLAVRHFVEQDLDAMLRRKDEADLPLQHPAIREALAKSPGQDVMVIVSTTLESTGRDHDFDWGVVEPVSARTVAQFAGRIHRHRTGLAVDNLIVLGYPLRHIDHKQESDACYYWPGPENRPSKDEWKNYRLSSHEATEVLPDKVIDARLSIRDFGLSPSNGQPPRAGLLAQLEQQVLEDRLDAGLAKAYLAKPLQKLSSNPSDRHIFRRSEKQVLFWIDEFGDWQACREGEFERSQLAGNVCETIKDVPEQRFLLRHGLGVSWLYQKILDDLRETDGLTMRCLLLGITLRAGSGSGISQVRFHGLLGLDKRAS